MTLAENVGLPLGEFTDLTPSQIREIAALKLALVGLSGFEDFYPNEISGGMQKRAGLARAMALDPEILFFDEPSAGLDPISSSLLDELILELRDSLGATVVIVTHELASIFAIGNNCVFLDAESRAQIASGDPKDLLAHSDDPACTKFLTRGKESGESAEPSCLNESVQAAIGIFVVGSFALMIAAIVVVGSGKLFNKTGTLRLHVPGRRERP